MNKQVTTRKLILTGILGILGVSAWAQGVSGSPYLSFQQRCAFLVSNPYVVKDLKLNPAQSKAAKAALNRYQGASQKLMNSTKATDREVRENDARLANDYLTLLTPAQKGLILKLGIEEVGTESLTDSLVAHKLALTQDQSAKIKRILAERSKKEEDVEAMEGEALSRIPEPKVGSDTKAYDKKRLDVYTSYEGERQRLQREKISSDHAIVNLLNPKQKKVWADWVGGIEKKAKTGKKK